MSSRAIKDKVSCMCPLHGRVMDRLRAQQLDRALHVRVPQVGEGEGEADTPTQLLNISLVYIK